MDVLSASSSYYSNIAWYENNGSGGFGEQRVITTSANGANSVYATDLNGPSIILSGGADKERFYLDRAEVGKTGTAYIRFRNLPNFEDPQDEDSDNVYEVEVKVFDSGGGSDYQTLLIEVTNENESPRITSYDGNTSVSLKIQENSEFMDTVSAEDVDSNFTLILSGPDAGAFTLDSNSGEIRLANLPDYENPLDVNGDNTYEVTVLAVDDGNLTDKQTLFVSVANLQDNDPEITSYGGLDTAILQVSENQKDGAVIHFLDEDGLSMNVLSASSDDDKIAWY